VPQREFKKHEFAFKPKQIAIAIPFPLPPPPKPVDKTLGNVSVTDSKPMGSQVDGKVAALCAYRMARGLYQYCAKKVILGT
jgi:hypothetical protein